MNQSAKNINFGRHVLIRVAEQTYALPIEAVEEVLAWAALTDLPNAPFFMAGVLDVAGQSVSVLSLNRLFGLPRNDPGPYTPLVLLRTSSPRLALEVDEVIRIVDLPASESTPISDDLSLNGCATASARVDDRTVLVLSPQKLLLDQERQRLAALTHMERQRLEALETATACS
jgi:purine-binding chemotaxis protein CheW